MILLIWEKLFCWHKMYLILRSAFSVAPTMLLENTADWKSCNFCFDVSKETVCLHCQFVSLCVEDIHFFSFCSLLDCFNIFFCDDCIFQCASAMSLHWTELRFLSNLDLPMQQAPCGAVFQSKYIVTDFTFQVYLLFLFLF